MKKHLLLLVLTFTFSQQGFATDCTTDCEGHFDKWYQGYDRARCSAEREIACKTKLTNCDTFKTPIWREGYFAVVTSVEESNRRWNFPADATSCHAFVDRLSTGYTWADRTRSGLAYLMQEGAKQSVSAAIGKAAWVGAAKAGIEAVLDCGCKHAKYTDRSNGDDDTPSSETPKYDYYSVSIVYDGKYSLWRGPNNASNRRNLNEKAKDSAGGGSDLRITSTFSTKRRTLTEAICDEGTYWATRIGKESSEHVFDEVRERKWKKCRLRTINFEGERSPDVSDRYFVSVQNGRSWGLRTGPESERERVTEEALAKVGGTATAKKSGRFSSNRITQTRVSCEKPPVDNGNGTQTTDSVIFLTSGVGYKSVQTAISIVEKKYKGSSCIFDVNDFAFGPETEI